MNIKSSDLVLEIGSGNNPNPRSDILVDRYLFDNGQRAGGFKIVVDRPLIIADGYRLPFKDKTFDYVICSHILEHLSDPQKFLTEIVRVGKAGYIEVPSDISERIFGWNFHLWYCSLSDKKLTLRRKKEGEQFGGFFHRLITNQIWFRRFFEENERVWYIRYEWKDKINLLIDNKTQKNYIKNLDDDAWTLMQKAKANYLKDLIFYINWMRRRIVKKLKKIIRKIYWELKILVSKNEEIKNLLPLLVCPICFQDNLNKNEEYLICGNCRSTFPIIHAIPIMLSPTELKKGY